MPHCHCCYGMPDCRDPTNLGAHHSPHAHQSPHPTKTTATPRDCGVGDGGGRGEGYPGRVGGRDHDTCSSCCRSMDHSSSCTHLPGDKGSASAQTAQSVRAAGIKPRHGGGHAALRRGGAAGERLAPSRRRRWRARRLAVWAPSTHRAGAHPAANHRRPQCMRARGIGDATAGRSPTDQQPVAGIYMQRTKAAWIPRTAVCERR